MLAADQPTMVRTLLKFKASTTAKDKVCQYLFKSFTCVCVCVCVCVFCALYRMA